MAVDPVVRRQQLREAQKRWRKRHRGEWKHRAIRQDAIKQAAEEGVDRWVVYARWGVDLSYKKWAVQWQKNCTSISKPAAPSI